MNTRAILAAVAIAFALPSAASAQHAGFRAGIRAPHHAAGRPGVVYPPVAIVGQNPYTGGYIYANPYSNPYGVPYGGYVNPPANYYIHGRTVIDSRVVVSTYPRGVGVPSHPVLPPVIIVPSARERFRAWDQAHANPAPGARVTYVPSTPVVPPGGGAIVGRTDGSRPEHPASGVRIGSTRAEVLSHFGQPTVSMANGAGEALVFGATTVLIQNGVVTRINSR